MSSAESLSQPDLPESGASGKSTANLDRSNLPDILMGPLCATRVRDVLTYVYQIHILAGVYVFQ